MREYLEDPILKVNEQQISLKTSFLPFVLSIRNMPESVAERLLSRTHHAGKTGMNGSIDGENKNFPALANFAGISKNFLGAKHRIGDPTL